MATALKDDSINQQSLRLLQELYNDNEKLEFKKISQILAEFRILTREKTLNPGVLSEKCISTLINYSIKCHTEAQKCLSNLILNYGDIRDQLIDPYVHCVESRLTTILDQKNDLTDSSAPRKQLCEVIYYDLRIIFLLSALCPASRTKIGDRLVDLVLKITDREAEDFSQDNYLLVVESLKTLFNLTLDKCINKSLAGDVVKKLFSVVGTENDLSDGCKTDSKLELTDQLLVNLIHLLTNMPEEVYLKLSDDDVNKILNHLDDQLKTYSKNYLRDTVLPVLNVCANICKCKEQVRKRWFEEILASAQDFEKRPEECDNLRGRLVKLMTSVDVHIKDIAAEFMHALCGGDAAKLITYTGFGNSAAFLSSRGLLTGSSNRAEGNDDAGGNMNYQELRNKIDPITGKLDRPRKNPMEGMSDEEKEYHAHELADAITKLTNLGIMKPMGVDSEGRTTDLHPSSIEKKQETKK